MRTVRLIVARCVQLMMKLREIRSKNIRDIRTGWKRAAFETNPTYYGLFSY